MPFALPPLYPIVDVRDPTADGLARARALSVALAEAGAGLIQLRAKTLDAGPMTALAANLVRSLAGHGCRVIVNDRADVAAASGAAGVHLGDTDLPVEAARGLLGNDALIGFSTHAVEEARGASGSSADYLGFGPVFESPTKAGVREARGIDLLSAACDAASHPVVAIGGATLETAPALWRAGAASVAVISEIERSTAPGDLVRAYRAAFETAAG